MSDVQAIGSAQPMEARSDILTLFTWNVQSNEDALALACKHIARYPGPYVASFQEVPRRMRAKDILTWSGGRLKLLTALPDTAAIDPSHHVVLVGSAVIGVDPTRSHELASEHDSERRMLGLSLFSTDGVWGNLQVLAIHGLDRLNYPTETERNSWARLMGATLGRFWAEGPLVVLGDLNANPFHDEVTSRDGLHALRRKDGLGERRKLANQQTYSVSLYNPMWDMLSDSDSGARGTYFFPRRRRTDLLWHCIDQIIVSAHLEPHLMGKPSILTCLVDDVNVPLLDADGTPMRQEDDPIYSDHLPVQISLDIKKVASCRISAKP